MNETAVFIVGSKSFFDGLDGFCSKDTDWLHLMDGWYLKQSSGIVKDNDKEHFLYPDKGLELIDDCIKQDDPLTAGKFLVPEFCKYIGATVSDIAILAPLFDRMDDKHKYETYIFNCYIQNNDISLTTQQLNDAYTIYKEARV